MPERSTSSGTTTAQHHSAKRDARATVRSVLTNMSPCARTDTQLLWRPGLPDMPPWSGRGSGSTASKMGSELQTLVCFLGLWEVPTQQYRAAVLRKSPKFLELTPLSLCPNLLALHFI